MLTKSDISEIGNLIDRKLESNNTRLEKSFDEKLEQKFDGKLKPIKSDLRKICKDIKAITTVFDKDWSKLQRRVTRVEAHLDLPPFQNPIE